MQIVFHWQAVLLSALVGLVVTAIWYSPLAFHQVLRRLSGDGGDGEAAASAQALGLGIAALAALATALCLDGFFNFTRSSSFGMGALAGLQLFIGLVLPAMAVAHVFSRRPALLLALHLGPLLINALLMGGLIASMR